ncbi:PDC sensor domain-containing protein [Sulfurospirillum arcachonense]|uniref:PDC sensor domain-containing protein n=1 Tax=Sulfurospirillum arcachonense TaxID=57666 RepID=UPI00046945C8|nr:PDC sensor domain-containing protein [Sulfurospirillum arcachonense]
MVVREIQQFSEVRPRARAYFCYLFTRNMPNRLPSPDLKTIENSLDKIVNEVDSFEALYVLDASGKQVTENLTNKQEYKGGLGTNRSNKSYFYRAVRQKRCVLTDPYPSILTNSLTVTAAYPIYDDKSDLKYVACMDISLVDVLKIAHPSSLQGVFDNFIKFAYSTFSLALLLVAFLLFYNGLASLISHGFVSAIENIEMMFKSTILLTLALAIFDLVKTIFEEEVLGRHKRDHTTGIHKTMVRFLGSIIIALAIEALMLVFKFAITDPTHIVSAVYLIGGVSVLLVALAFYVKSVSQKEEDDDSSN